jgi:hypothetical protein
MNKPSLSLTLVLAFAAAAPAAPSFYLAGDWNGWNATGTLMTDLGGGLWQANLTGLPGRHEFKVTGGDWSQNWPGSGNSWLLADPFGNVTVTFNANSFTDGWRGDWGRIGLNVDPGNWTAVGDWQGWNNLGNAMTPVGGGIYSFQQALAPGWYQWKAVVTGTWDGIGDDFRGVNANTTWFEITAANPVALFEVNAFAGTTRVSVVPEPAITALLLLGLVGVPMYRRLTPGL